MFLKHVSLRVQVGLYLFRFVTRGADAIVNYEVLCSLLLGLYKLSVSISFVCFSGWSILSRVLHCFHYSCVVSDVFVCGLISSPRLLCDGIGTHCLGCVDVFCFRSDAVC